jgi:SAM-dependent methyltransferase
MMPEKFNIQNNQYSFPYHYLVDFSSFNNYQALPWGWEYFAYVNKVLELIKIKDCGSVLDFGCGEGKITSEISRVNPTARIKGIDLSARAILFARAFNYGKKIDFSAEDIKDINEKFDVVAAVEVMEHISDEDIKCVFEKFKNILNDNGRLVISVPSDNFPVQPKHYRHYNKSLIERQAEGFILEEIHYMVRGGFRYVLANKLFGKLCVFPRIRKIIFYLTKKFLFAANEHNARHIVASFKKR